MSDVRYYSVRVDGHEIEALDLQPEQYKTQAGRDAVRQQVAERHGIGTWGLRLQEIGRPYIVYTDMETGKQIRKEIKK